MSDLMKSDEFRKLVECFAEEEEKLNNIEPEREQFNLNGYLVNMISPAKDKYKSFIKYIYLIKSGELLKVKSYYNKTFYPFGNTEVITLDDF